MAFSGPTGAASRVELLAWVESLAATYRWAGHRGLNRVRPGLEAEVLLGTYSAAFDDPNAFVRTIKRDGAVAAATIVKPKPMETDSFQVATAALSPIVCSPDVPDRVTLVKELLEQTSCEAADVGVELLVLRVDAEDVETLVAAQGIGFKVYEATSTWLAEGDTPPSADPRGVEVQVHEGNVKDGLTQQEVRDLAAATAKWDLNHFHADPLVPREGLRRFYSQWVHNIASGQWSDCLFVARHGGRIAGIESELTDEEVQSTTGVRVRAAEWFLVLEHGLGVGKALANAAGRHKYPGGSHHVWETQARNLPSIRCIQQTGIARPIRSAYTLHAWPRHR